MIAAACSTPTTFSASPPTASIAFCRSRAIRPRSTASTARRAASWSVIVDGAGAYGCLGLYEKWKLDPGEVLFVGVDTFADAAARDAAQARIDADPRVRALYAEFTAIVDLTRVVRVVGGIVPADAVRRR